eukprot:5702574-Amphidinium_carterae.1
MQYRHGKEFSPNQAQRASEPSESRSTLAKMLPALIPGKASHKPEVIIVSVVSVRFSPWRGAKAPTDQSTSLPVPPANQTIGLECGLNHLMAKLFWLFHYRSSFSTLSSATLSDNTLLGVVALCHSIFHARLITLCSTLCVCVCVCVAANPVAYATLPTLRFRSRVSCQVICTCSYPLRTMTPSS